MNALHLRAWCIRSARLKLLNIPSVGVLHQFGAKHEAPKEQRERHDCTDYPNCNWFHNAPLWSLRKNCLRECLTIEFGGARSASAGLSCLPDPYDPGKWRSRPMMSVSLRAGAFGSFFRFA
jgi:hypothetical protein